MQAANSASGALQARTEADNAAELTKRRSTLGAVLEDVNTAFASDLKRIESESTACLCALHWAGFVIFTYACLPAALQPSPRPSSAWMRKLPSTKTWAGSAKSRQLGKRGVLALSLERLHECISLLQP